MKKLDLDTPVAIVDLDVMERNINRMANYAKKVGINLRPHVKTHKIPELAQKQIDAGAIGVTVAKIGEAEVMALAGINDIFIAYQIVGKNKIERLINLAHQAQLTVAVDDFEVAKALSDAFSENNLTIDVIAIVELGFDRCGVSPGRETAELVKKISSLNGARFKGIMGYAGQVYGAKSWDEVVRIGSQEAQVMVSTADMITASGIQVEVVSVGSTPTARIAGSVPGITEIRPGAYLFNDRVEMAIGAAEQTDCALSILSTVISRPKTERAIIDAGDKVFSQDRGLEGMKGFGLVVDRPGIELERLNEEHGILNVSGQDRNLRIGDKLEIIPNHACPVCNLFDQLVGTRNDQVEVIWPVLARGKVN